MMLVCGGFNTVFYQEIAKSKVSNRKKILLILSILFLLKKLLKTGHCYYQTGHANIYIYIYIIITL
jgi:hypothetical protein